MKVFKVQFITDCKLVTLIVIAMDDAEAVATVRIYHDVKGTNDQVVCEELSTARPSNAKIIYVDTQGVS